MMLTHHRKIKFMGAYGYLNPTLELHLYGAAPELHLFCKRD